MHCFDNNLMIKRIHSFVLLKVVLDGGCILIQRMTDCTSCLGRFMWVMWRWNFFKMFVDCRKPTFSDMWVQFKFNTIGRWREGSRRCFNRFWRKTNNSRSISSQLSILHVHFLEDKSSNYWLNTRHLDMNILYFFAPTQLPSFCPFIQNRDGP
jgi:hypothetical protein